MRSARLWIRSLHSRAALREAALSGEYQPLGRWQLPEEIVVRPAEGFAWYAVYPEMYSAAARRFVHERRPVECVVIGIRSIGTTLSTVVEHELRAHGIRAVSLTVRPRGHPFDRTLVLSEELERMLRARSRDHFLIVDEGPGLSGSSFISVAETTRRTRCSEQPDCVVSSPRSGPEWIPL